MRLTKRRIDKLEYDSDGPNQQIIWDEKLSNFGVRLYESGTKSFVIRYRNKQNRRRYITLGKFGVLTLQQARNMAREKFVEIHQGEDPAAKKKRAQATSVEELVEAYIDKYAKSHRKTWEQDERRLKKHIVPRWGSRQPESLTRSDVSDLHRDIGENARVEANRVVAVIQTMYNFAADEGIVEDGLNPASKVKKFSEGSRERWLREDEIPRLAASLDEVDNPHMRTVFWMLLLTGGRRNEMLEARWEHVDLDRRELFFPDTKNGTDHTVPLSDPAVELLEELPRENGNPYIFPSPRVDGQHIVNINDAWHRIRKRADLDDVWIHDFRRTVASWLAQAGYSMLVIKKLLNHAVRGPTGIYARMDPEAVRKAVDEYGGRLMAAAESEDRR